MIQFLAFIEAMSDEFFSRNERLLASTTQKLVGENQFVGNQYKAIPFMDSISLFLFYRTPAFFISPSASRSANFSFVLPSLHLLLCHRATFVTLTWVVPLINQTTDWHIDLFITSNFFKKSIPHHRHVPAPDRKDNFRKLCDIVWTSLDELLSMHIEEMRLEELMSLENESTTTVEPFERQLLMPVMTAPEVVEGRFHHVKLFLFLVKLVSYFKTGKKVPELSYFLILFESVYISFHSKNRRLLKIETISLQIKSSSLENIKVEAWSPFFEL